MNPNKKTSHEIVGMSPYDILIDEYAEALEK